MSAATFHRDHHHNELTALLLQPIIIRQDGIVGFAQLPGKASDMKTYVQSGWNPVCGAGWLCGWWRSLARIEPCQDDRAIPERSIACFDYRRSKIHPDCYIAHPSSILNRRTNGAGVVGA
jgi:hypothetical protein